MKKLLLILSLLIVNSQLLIGDIRYVSHSGSSTPPYLTWETAADSIMSAINISSFGDTIYVANGVYEEQVVMIPGLSLIGAGMDSCIIDTRDLVNAVDFVSVEVPNNCLFSGFNINVYYNSSEGYGITAGANSLIKFNKITTGGIGAYIGTNPTIYTNIFSNVTMGLWLFNSNSVVRKNIISTDPNSNMTLVAGIEIEAFDHTYKPLIDSNIIYPLYAYGIHKSFGSTPTISNNIIILDSNYAGGAMSLYLSDTVKVFNNLILGYSTGIYTEGGSGRGMNVYNNYILGYIATGIISGPDDSLKNNVIVNAGIAIKKWLNQPPPVVKYNNLWNNTVNYSGFTVSDSSNIYEDPMVINDDSTKGDLDFHLQMFSPLIDAGDPDILDRDGSRSDIGLYGGPYGWTYTYNDLAPRPPHNVTAVIEQGLVKLTWNRNTEADFSHYRIFRDTVSNFTYDTTKIIGETTDTVYYDNLPPVNGEKNYYYLITAFDNQGNQSYPSEEVTVLVTGLTEHPPIGSEGYRLLSNYPNPFNPSTIIPYRLKKAGYVKLYIYDIKGELVTTLVNQWQNKGYYEVVFRPTEDQKQRATGMEVPIGPTYSDMASGVYLYMIMVSNERNVPVFSDMGKMILLK